VAASPQAAGCQLGEIQRQHPQQLHTLLQRVLRYLFSVRHAHGHT
jgi:hypothetical protein